MAERQVIVLGLSSVDWLAMLLGPTARHVLPLTVSSVLAKRER